MVRERSAKNNTINVYYNGSDNTAAVNAGDFSENENFVLFLSGIYSFDGTTFTDFRDFYYTDKEPDQSDISKAVVYLPQNLIWSDISGAKDSDLFAKKSKNSRAGIKEDVTITIFGDTPEKTVVFNYITYTDKDEISVYAVSAKGYTFD